MTEALALAEKSARISKTLRRQRLELEREAAPVNIATHPDVYFEFAPSGTYPIIAFRTVPCDHYLLGHCSPCSYSARPYPAGVGRDEIYASLEPQVVWLERNFDDLFTSRASGQLDGYHFRKSIERPCYMLQIAGEGSFFRDAEIPPAHRRMILERLAALQEARDINLHVMLETRPENLLAAEEQGELEALAPLFRELNVVVNMGYEHHDPFLRNVMFGKVLDERDFQKAVALAHRHRLDPGVFVFAGGHGLTVAKCLTELDGTLTHLENLGVFVNVMVPNLQAYTLPDLLFEIGAYDLPEPFFLLDVADRLLNYHPNRPHPVTPFDWFIGGMESDPIPRVTMLNNPRSNVPRAVTEQVLDCQQALTRTMDSKAYTAEARRLRLLPAYEKYFGDTAANNHLSCGQRLNALLDLAERSLETYDQSMRAAVAANLG
ncbi:MAG TPA: hypothetical protein ENI79_02205 [Rhodospirillales bacterium]|nr:hypothetical protein [Rhodospirillales bacterium]